MGQGEQSLKLLAEGQQWNRLGQEAGQASGGASLYYHGLALLRTGKSAEGLGMMKRVIQSRGSIADKDILGHALYLISQDTMKSFRSVGKGEPVTPQLIKQQK